MIAMLLQCFHKDRNAGHRVTIAVMCYITIKFSRETGDDVTTIIAELASSLTQPGHDRSLWLISPSFPTSILTCLMVVMSCWGYWRL